MTKERNQFFARAISKSEFHFYIECDEIPPETEWVEIKKNLPMELGIRFLKERWVDPAYRRRLGDVYDLIIGVRAKMGEFIVKPGVGPLRHINRISVPTARMRIIYDPRKVIASAGVDLDLKNPTKLLR